MLSRQCVCMLGVSDMHKKYMLSTNSTGKYASKETELWKEKLIALTLCPCGSVQAVKSTQ